MSMRQSLVQRFGHDLATKQHSPQRYHASPVNIPHPHTCYHM